MPIVTKWPWFKEILKPTWISNALNCHLENVACQCENMHWVHFEYETDKFATETNLFRLYMNWFISLNIRIDILFDNCCGILKRIIPCHNNNDLDHKNQPINHRAFNEAFIKWICDQNSRKYSIIYYHIDESIQPYIIPDYT